MSAREDQADIEKVLAGDSSAFAGIVRRWQGPMINLAYRFCGDRGRAEDMAQEVFLRVYRGLAKWRGDAAFSTWLFAVATNLYRTELRRIPVGTVSIDNAFELNDPRTGAKRMDANLDNEDRARMVRRAVAALPAKYREALILFYFQDMDVPAAARSLGLPEGTVKAQLFRARKLLEKKLPPMIRKASYEEFV